MNQCYLRHYPLRPEWRPFLIELGWNAFSPTVFSDGWSFAYLDQEQQRPTWFGFETSAQTLVDPKLRPSARESHLKSHKSLDIVSPAGFIVRFCHQEVDRVGSSLPDFCMNHVSLEVQDVQTERLWFEQRLGKCTILARDAAWEPVSRTYVQDCHLFRSPFFYITLRKGNDSPGVVDHVGWMTRNRELVDRAASIIKSLGWPIVVGPEEIDGSYLVHFRGPDARVHDAFCPLDQIKQRAVDV